MFYWLRYRAVLSAVLTDYLCIILTGKRLNNSGVGGDSSWGKGGFKIRMINTFENDQNLT